MRADFKIFKIFSFAPKKITCEVKVERRDLWAKIQSVLPRIPNSIGAMDTFLMKKVKSV